MRKRAHYWPFFILLCTAALLAAAAGWWFARQTPTPAAAPVPATAPDQGSLYEDKRQIHLYFSDQDGRYLHAEPRLIHKTKDGIAFGRLLVEELIRGPRDGGGRTLPENAGIRSFFLSNAGKAYIDFDAAAFQDHPGGVGAELLSIYSVVNTLVLNSDVIRSVQFLIGGREADTMAGHVDLNRPFTANMLLVR